MRFALLLLALPCFGQVVTRTVCGPGGPISQNTGISAGEQVNAQSGTSYTYQNTDCGKLVKHSNSMAIAASLPHANATTFRTGWFMDVSNAGVGTVTITPVTSTIDGLATLALLTNEGVRVISNGTNYFTIRGKVTSGGGGGTVTNVGTTAPITGGPITTTGTIACATCVVGPGSATSGHIATFNGTTGVLIQDGGAPATGTVTSVATTSPITGGPVTTTGTIACASCVTSSTPGAGVAHFAGSTQAVTSSAVALSDLATQAADTVVMNATGSTAAPTAVAMPTCTTGAVLYNTSTHAWSCVSTGGGGSGGLTLVEQHTASTTTNLDFTTCLSSTYDTYQIEIENLIPTTNSVYTSLRFSTDGGMTYDSGANYTYGSWRWVNGGAAQKVTGSSTEIVLEGGGGVDLLSNAANQGLTGTYRLAGTNTSAYKNMTGTSAFLNTVPTFEGATVNHQYTNTTTVNAFRISPSGGGTWASGTIRCYGLAK